MGETSAAGRAQAILDTWDHAWADLCTAVGRDVNGMRDVIQALLDENEHLRALVADEHGRLSQDLDRESEYKALLVGVECVLLDHAAELSGPLVDANLADLAYRFLAVVGDAVPAGIRDALETAEELAGLCGRCGGIPCSTCGECPRQGCWDCRCGQQGRDDDEQDGEGNE